MAEADPKTSDPAVIAWHVDVTYEVFGGKRRGNASGQGERQGLRRLITPQRQIGNVSYVHAVKDVSFIAHRGESIGIIGHNGSGKSTLLRALAGLVPPTNGHIWLHGEPSLLGVNAVLLNQLSGERNVYIGGQALGLTREQVRERYDEIVELADIGEAIGRPMATYSSGQGARLRFAISTAVRPEILMIDEALATGDAAFRQRSMDKINEILAGASTVFLVSHSNSTITDMCQRALWLDHGHLVMDGPAGDVVAEYASGRVPPPLSEQQPEQLAGTLPSEPTPEPGANLKVIPVDTDEERVITTVVWGPGSSLWGRGTAATSPQRHAELFESLSNSGVVNLACVHGAFAAEDIVQLKSTGLQENCVYFDMADEPLAVALPEMLSYLSIDPAHTVLIDADEVVLSSVENGLPGIRTKNSNDPATFHYLQQVIRRYEGSDTAPVEATRALVRRHHAQRRSRSGETTFLGRHGVKFTVLDGLAGLHLAPRVETLVRRARAGNYTDSHFAAGQVSQWLGDLRRNRAVTVMAWDDFGVHGVVGFVSVHRRKGTLQHFVFSDAAVGLGLPEGVAAALQGQSGFEQTEFPVGSAPPWVRFVNAEEDAAASILAAYGLEPSGAPDIRVLAGRDTGAVALALQPASLNVQDAAGQESMKTALDRSYTPGAPVVTYWAGMECDDRIWGAGAPGLELYQRTAQTFIDRHAGVKLVVLLPSERFTDHPHRPNASVSRVREFNQVWRELAEGNDSVELLEAGELVAGPVSSPAALTPDLVAAWTHRLRALLAVGTAPVLPGIEPPTLRPVAEFVEVGALSEHPLPLPDAWGDASSRVWEIEVRATANPQRARGALLLIDTDHNATLREEGGITRFGKPAAEFYHYLRTERFDGVTRFVMIGDEPFTPSNLALQLWGSDDVAVDVERVRVWVHAELVPEHE
ncbi:ABC transporter ATP-binding protein [Enemella sp. A6]|uniref:ABC transporter ATP-binding protein n=1 Tax=Enemella sp. A6 TaxID=3440152 RepID=UPI003EBD16A4